MLSREDIIKALRQVRVAATPSMRGIGISIAPWLVTEAIDALESSDLTPEQRAERRLRARWPNATRVDVRSAPEGRCVASVELPYATGHPDDFIAYTTNAPTANEAAVRLIERCG